MCIQHLLYARHCAQKEGFSSTQDRNVLCPQLVGRLAGKTNMPTDYSKLYLKILEKNKKRPNQNSTAENRTWCIQSQLKGMAPYWDMADKCSCYFHNSKNNVALDS